jgi:hypothetical protein
MARLYTTPELAQILAQERDACLRGDRLNLTTPPTLFNPVVDPFVNVEGIQKFRAFCDFRDAIHAYQQEYDVSGLVWRTFSINDQSIHYPEVDEHLIALPNDLEILATYKNSVFKFWQQVTDGMALYRQMGKQTPHQPTNPNDIDQRAQRSEWAYLHKLDYPGALEIAIQLGWGNPKEALYQKYLPTSGCCFIHAVSSGQIPQGAYY